MTAHLYITSSCSVANNTIVKNNKKLFEQRDTAVQSFLVAAYQHFAINYPRFYKMDNLSKLGWLTAEILLENSFEKANYRAEDIGLVLSNKNSSLDTDIKYYETVKTIASPALFVYTLPNIVMGEICIRHNFKGENDFFIFETFEPPFIHQYVSGLLETGALETCICGWVETLENQYRSVLYLIEKKESEGAIPFTEENIHHIYQLTYG